jgi:two-component system sensor histidine kinase UhpB
LLQKCRVSLQGKGLIYRVATVNRDNLPIADLLDSVADGFIVADEAASVVFANKTAEALFGYEPGELQDLPIADLIPQRLRDTHDRHVSSFMAAPRVRPMGLGMDLVGRRKDGSEFNVEISLSPFRLQDKTYITAIVRNVSERKQLEDDRHALELELETERERHRIAMDLHDGTIQDIYGAALTLEIAQDRIDDERFADAEYVERAADQLRNVVSGIRSYIFDLRPRHFGGSLPTAIAELAFEFQENTQIETETDIDKTLTVDAKTALAVYNIAHESLSNIRRHARATKVRVTLRPVEGKARLSISDDGVGFDPFAPRTSMHRGLRNITSRAHAINGRLNIESAPGKGTELRLDFSIQEA